MRERHIVPLSPQAIAPLREFRGVTRKSRYPFPSLQSRNRPMSVNTVYEWGPMKAGKILHRLVSPEQAGLLRRAIANYRRLRKR
jgi:integrase